MWLKHHVVALRSISQNALTRSWGQGCLLLLESLSLVLDIAYVMRAMSHIIWNWPRVPKILHTEIGTLNSDLTICIFN